MPYSCINITFRSYLNIVVKVLLDVIQNLNMRFLYISVLVLFFNAISAQNLTGIWKANEATKLYGHEVEDFEMQIIQTNSLFEVLISYRYNYNYRDRGNTEILQKIIAVSSSEATHDSVGCGCFSDSGIINKNAPYTSGVMKITEIKHLSCRVTTVGQANDSIGDCQYLNYILKWSKIGSEEYLSGPGLTYGTFSGGNIKLKKVGNFSSQAQYDFIKKNAIINLPKVVVKVPVLKPKAPNIAFTIKKNKQVDLPKTTVIPSSKKTKSPDVVANSASMKKDAPISLDLKTRENKIGQTIIVNSKQVELSIYDYGQIDHDIISVYVDKKPVLVKEELTKKPLIVNLEMDEYNETHEVILVAENLGDIPPNTALMKIKAGNKNYEIKITSDEQKNAVVIFKYEK